MKKTYEAHPEARASARAILPAGAYEAVILSAKVEQTSWGVERLIIAFDITAGEFKDFFKKDFDANTNEDKKWRGVYRLNVPNGDGSDKDSWRQKTFNSFIWALEDSNANYSWDWEEAKLKNKKIGVNFRRKEWEINGRSGWTTECGAVESVEDVKAGKCRKLKDKALEKKEEAAPAFNLVAADGNDDLPF